MTGACDRARASRASALSLAALRSADGTTPCPLPRSWRAAAPRGPDLARRAARLVRAAAAPEGDPHRQRALGVRTRHGRRDDARAAHLRLLRLPAALLPDPLRRPGRSGR